MWRGPKTLCYNVAIVCKLNKEEYSGSDSFVPVPEKIEKQPPNHIVVVCWVSNTLTVLAQAPVPNADKTERRVLFVDHRSGRVPQLEAIGIARSIARKNKRPDTIVV